MSKLQLLYFKVLDWSYENDQRFHDLENAVKECYLGETQLTELVEYIEGLHDSTKNKQDKQFLNSLLKFIIDPV